MTRVGELSANGARAASHPASGDPCVLAKPRNMLSAFIAMLREEVRNVFT